jgi:hypothetical protein
VGDELGDFNYYFSYGGDISGGVYCNQIEAFGYPGEFGRVECEKPSESHETAMLNFARATPI